ncbi:threonine/serine exporter family protein [Paludibacter sp.]|uniref:threonine/serine ThrE exporter family protein n=1 Tax=Paludibacter sp. TaxID=1898105 RepID=UPI0013534CBF|nr:threonine/serine exporter family protein [Paludibacter sp.]MTK53242.1 threonine/serine exporter family protein [Paludibacter sp.]
MDQVKFVAEYAAHLMGCGIHTSRVIRNTKRLGDALNFDVNISVFQKSIILTIQKNETQQIFSEVIEIPALPISFEHNAELSGLSWEAVDRKLSFEEIKAKYDKIVSAPRMNQWLVLLLVGLANASFCRLFGGDWLSMFIVCIATFAGFYTRLFLQARKINHYIIFIVSAFIASMLSSTALLFNTTSDIALATSVLYLIPGVPLINGVIDIIEGHTLTGISRLTNAFLLIICIAIGLSFTLFLFTNRLV